MVRIRRCRLPKPDPSANVEGVPAPETAIIVKYDGAHWVDEAGTVYDEKVPFSLPDLDVFEIDAFADPPVELRSFPGVGTTLFGMVVHPKDGTVYVSNLEARNEVRFEGPGPSSARPSGAISWDDRITWIAPDGSVEPRRLNDHVDYDVPMGEAIPVEEKSLSLSTPLGMAITADGSRVYFGGVRLRQSRRVRRGESPRRRDRGRSDRALGRARWTLRGRTVARRALPLRRFAIRQCRHRARHERRSCARVDRDVQPRARRHRARAGPPLRRSAELFERHGVVRDVPYLRRQRRPGLGPGKPRCRRRGQPESVRSEFGYRRARVPSDEGADDDADVSRHRRQRSDALARRSNGPQRPRSTRGVRRAGGVQGVRWRVPIPSRSRGAAGGGPRWTSSPTSPSELPILRVPSAISTTH